MNCKPGDLAMVTYACEQQGRITRCIRIAGPDDLVMYGFLPQSPPIWLVEDEFDYQFTRAPLILDQFLRPLRDRPGEDETLTWAPVPGVKAPA